jgi:Domain of unknown function (DUF384)
MDPDLWMRGPDHQRDIDVSTRLHCVEAILLLCETGRANRNLLRVAKTYVILKHCDMVEESEDVSDRIDVCDQYLRRDEEGTAEGSSDRLMGNAFKPGGEHSNMVAVLLEPSVSSQLEIVKEEDANMSSGVDFSSNSMLPKTPQTVKMRTTTRLHPAAFVTTTWHQLFQSMTQTMLSLSNERSIWWGCNRSKRKNPSKTKPLRLSWTWKNPICLKRSSNTTWVARYFGNQTSTHSFGSLSDLS